ncbi:C6 transcription factor, putative [Cordyceps militaris CM01]|uniref:C6 transcription factor, putative n=1 Tax=Cordyceps militaris (strain CM01) TaxID=983644 RepID=G3JCC8_CORMM|nr:C6 transcription factor, putative [Cordyceps militaris CM01]EGX93793.1 C6 transcription factor, putative [Cordyceps militaris CM01]
MVNQRSKSGCWTCRLRRKKCPEDGMPCSNCKARGVVCHGYGPRPAWKDRGQREQEEVDRLQLRRRSQQTRWHAQQLFQQQHPERPPYAAQEASQATPAHDDDDVCLSPSLALASPDETALGPSPPPSTDAREESADEYDFSAMLDLQLSLPSLHTPPSVMSGLWASGVDGLLVSTPALFDASSATTLNSQGSGSQGDAAYSALPAAALGAAAASLHISALQEREIELMMQFLGHDFGRLHPRAQAWSMTDKAWLLWLLHRSPTFFYTALSTSAYFAFLQTPPHDGRRTEHFREYDHFRNRAMERYCQLLDAGCRGGVQGGSVGWQTRETVICSVQLAMLEALSENLNATLTYLDSASDALAKCSEDLVYMGELSPTKPAAVPAASRMERRTVEFFTYSLIRVHVLHCSSCHAMPAAASLYRRLLSSGLSGDSFFHVAGFQAWALVALLDAVGAALWKQEQEAQNRLSMRELVGKADDMLSNIERQIQGASDAQTLIFAYGVCIYIHTLTSGCRPAVPEIHDTLERSVPLWEASSFGHGELRSMSWAFCVSASLATGHHRAAFSNVLAEAAMVDPSSTTVACLRALSEECWKILDGGGADCNWRLVMQHLKPSIWTIFI